MVGFRENLFGFWGLFSVLLSIMAQGRVNLPNPQKPASLSAVAVLCTPDVKPISNMLSAGIVLTQVWKQRLEF